MSKFKFCAKVRSANIRLAPAIKNAKTKVLRPDCDIEAFKKILLIACCSPTT